MAGRSINPQNLSEWRLGGFAEWQARQEMVADTQELGADAAELAGATAGRLADDLATVLCGRYAAALARWDGEPTEAFRQKLKVLRGLCRDIAELRRGENNTARVRMAADRIEAEREKTEEEVVAQFVKWSQVPAVRDWLCQTWETPRERERKKRELFGLPPLPEEEAEGGEEQAGDGGKGGNSQSTIADSQEEAGEPQESLAGEVDGSLDLKKEGGKAGNSQLPIDDGQGEDAGTSRPRPGAGGESSQIKPNQTKNEAGLPEGRSGPEILEESPVRNEGEDEGGEEQAGDGGKEGNSQSTIADSQEEAGEPQESLAGEVDGSLDLKKEGGKAGRRGIVNCQ